MLTHFSLFSGVEGIGLAAKWAGFTTVGLCEIDPFCQKVLRKHYPDTPIYSDVREIERIPKVTLLTAGIPCQKHSSVNRKRDGDAFEWCETNRIIQSSPKPDWVVVENVDGMFGTIHDTICDDLEGEGYEVRTFNIPAVAVGAPHERYRVFIVGNSNSEPVLQADTLLMSCRKERNAWQNPARTTWGSLAGTHWGENQPPICGVDDGNTGRLYRDRMKALGNMVVPQQIYPILKCIAEIERESD